MNRMARNISNTFIAFLIYYAAFEQFEGIMLFIDKVFNYNTSMDKSVK